MSCSYIYSSSKFPGTSPNVFKIVASPKFPIFGSPLRLNASCAANLPDSAFVLATERGRELGASFSGDVQQRSSWTRMALAIVTQIGSGSRIV